MKIRNKIYWIAVLVLVACTADDADLELTPAQQQLIGQGVNFSASIASPFITRSTNQHNGDFNEGDQMRIFRQYADESGTLFEGQEIIYRDYYLKMDYAAGSGVSLNTEWVPMEKDNYLTWENGKTVRFRAWSRSNLAGKLNNATKTGYYPDYTVSDWVTVSGPTQNIPLTMRHLACRVGLTAKNGNELSSGEICLKDEDYDTPEDAKAVNDTYQKLCIPAGVDDETFLLTAMTSTLFNDENTDFKDLKKYTEQDGIVKMGTQTADFIANAVQRPLFNGNDGRLYFMTIPIDMSSENAGAALVLPACTRFRVRLVGENKDHIFELRDIKDGSGQEKYPNGLTLHAGYSYTFSVGYHYDKFTITADDHFAWTEDNISPGSINDETKSDDNNFDWFFEKYVEVVAKSIKDNSKVFEPEFDIKNARELISFIALVNGTAAKKMDGIKRGELREQNDTNGVRSYWWILTDEVDENGEPKKVSREEAEALGYLFYPRFYPSVSTEVAYAEEVLITGPMDFSKLQINLTQDIDLTDQQITSIGTADHPFKGFFNGNGYTIRNVNSTDGYLFNNVAEGAITNLKIESTHPVCLLNSGTKVSIAGVSMQCPSQTYAIANTLTGDNYVVGCIHVGHHVGTTGGALVGTATKLNMLGCMQTADGIVAGSGALLGSGSVNRKMFKYNYYDIQASPKTNAVGSTADAYEYEDYIRGVKSHVLKAVKDYKLDDDVDLTLIKPNVLMEIYGLAPWNAMNKGIDKYNEAVDEKYKCKMNYKAFNEAGFTNRYPILYKVQ